MKPFLDENFLLTNPTAEKLYHDFAKDRPIIDYHNHLSAQDICLERKYADITELWLQHDHYKWRAMRAFGVDEKYITGDGDNKTKFLYWARTVERLVGSPLYHWTHLELQRYFGIDISLSLATVDEIYDRTKELLEGEGFDAASLLRKMNVRVLCTTNDPFEKLEWHEELTKKDIGFKVLPTFRPDKLFNLDQPGFAQAVALLEARFGIKIDSFEKLKTALSASLDYFCAIGCRLSDHAFTSFVYSDEPADVDTIFCDALQEPVKDSKSVTAYKSELLRFLFAEYSKRNMAAQLHLGALRNNSSRLFDIIGPDAGGDSVGMPTNITALSKFMDDMDRVGTLPKTILYTLSSSELTALSTMAVNFAHGCPARIQLGPAWWFLDSKRGMIRQINELMETGLLSGFSGMVTDSRAFTSFCRHEYFRRILCNEIGLLVENGEYPNEPETLGRLIEDICYRNAVAYFSLKI